MTGEAIKDFREEDPDCDASNKPLPISDNGGDVGLDQTTLDHISLSIEIFGWAGLLTTTSSLAKTLLMSTHTLSSLVVPDLGITLVAPSEKTGFLALPAELRIAILEYVFDDELQNTSLENHKDGKGVVLRDDYSAARKALPLLTCRQMYDDGSIAALQRTSFVVTNMFYNIPERLGIFQPRQLKAIRSIAFVADDRHFRRLSSWGTRPFGLPDLCLDTLTIALHRSSSWHYLFDYTTAIVKLLRQLEGVERFAFIRNNARVKGSFRAWCNRLVGLILKIDHQERYMVDPPNPEKVWWTWNFDSAAQSLSLEAGVSKPMVDEETYMQQVLPLMKTLTTSVEAEEWNPDPRSRIMYY